MKLVESNPESLVKSNELDLSTIFFINFIKNGKMSMNLQLFRRAFLDNIKNGKVTDLENEFQVDLYANINFAKDYRTNKESEILHEYIEFLLNEKNK